MATAKKLDPQKWARAKARAKAKMGGKHSARAMQLAVKYYKDMGVIFSGDANVDYETVLDYLYEDIV